MDKESEKRVKPVAKTKKENPNAGHRSRLRIKYSNGNIDSLEFHEILELLLYYPLPRIDTNKIAHALKKKFHGSISEIFEASDKLLKEIPGVSDQTVLFFKFLKDITRIYNLEITNKPDKKTDKKSHEEHLIAHFTGKQNEEVVLITLNNRMERISEKPDVIYIGSVNSTKVDMNKMVKTALDNNASSVIVAHNHPDGPDYPSPQDIETTRRMERVFTEISINFIDHYIVSNKKISSIKEQSVYSYVRNNRLN